MNLSIQKWITFILWISLFSLHFIGGSRGRARRTPPLRVRILSFWHAKFSKRNCFGSPICLHLIDYFVNKPGRWYKCLEKKKASLLHWFRDRCLFSVRIPNRKALFPLDWNTSNWLDCLQFKIICFSTEVSKHVNSLLLESDGFLLITSWFTFKLLCTL